MTAPLSLGLHLLLGVAAGIAVGGGSLPFLSCWIWFPVSPS